MILTDYEEIMDRIEVTEEMQERILNRLETVDFEKANRVMSFSAFKKFGALAASLVVLLAGAAVLPYVFRQGQTEQPPGLVLSGNGITEAASAEELSESLGFSVSGLRVLPFEAEETAYRDCWQEFAEIEYSGEKQNAVFRKAPGDRDVSGDYQVYETVIERISGANTVTLKGSTGQFELAVWSDGEFSYSVSLSGGISEKEMLRIVSGAS